MHEVREPEGQAIDQDRPIGTGRLGEHVAEGQRLLDRLPERAAPFPMPADALRHLTWSGNQAVALGRKDSFGHDLFSSALDACVPRYEIGYFFSIIYSKVEYRFLHVNSMSDTGHNDLVFVVSVHSPPR